MNNPAHGLAQCGVAVRRLAVGICMAGALLLPAGCGGSPRVAVEGTVSVNGRPLEEGAITLIPLAGTPGASAGARIVKGRFSMPAAKGPMPGRFRVEITAAGPTGRMVESDEVPPRMVPEFGQILPAKFNSKSELTAELPAGGRAKLDFSL